MVSRRKRRCCFQCALASRWRLAFCQERWPGSCFHSRTLAVLLHVLGERQDVASARKRRPLPRRGERLREVDRQGARRNRSTLFSTDRGRYSAWRCEQGASKARLAAQDEL